MNDKIKVIPEDKNLEAAEKALREVGLTSHELVRMLGVCSRLYDEKLAEETEFFRNAML